MNTTDELIDLSAIYLSVCLKMNVKELSTIPRVVGYCVSLMLFLYVVLEWYLLILMMSVRSLLGRILTVLIFLHFIFLFYLFKQTSTKIFDSIISKHYFIHVVMFVCFEIHA
jgi:hypothetical protein